MCCFYFPFCLFQIFFSTFLESLNRRPCAHPDLKLCCVLLVKARCQIFLVLLKEYKAHGSARPSWVNRLIYWVPMWHPREIVLYFDALQKAPQACSSICSIFYSSSLQCSLKTWFDSGSSSYSTTRFDHRHSNGKHIKAWTIPSLASPSASCWKRFSQLSSPRLDRLYDQMEPSLLATEGSLSLTWLTPLCTVAWS